MSPDSTAYNNNNETETLISEAKPLPNQPTKTLNQTEADISRDWHDYFNLIALIPIIVTAALNYNYQAIFNLESFDIVYLGHYFWANWAVTTLYFLADLVWVARVPICVKSPGVIIKHHIVAMIYLIGPVCYPEYRWFMGAILSVEVNTWFLICRRVMYKSSGKPVSPVLSETVSMMFYLTWILIRCIIYPAVLVEFLRLAVEKIAETGTLWHLPMIFIPAHFALCVLNLKWTYDLFAPIIKRWMGTGPRTMVVQNGL